MPQSFSVLTTALVLFPVLAADARGQQLLKVDGVELRGEARLVMSGGGTCNVLESDTSYVAKKENHGAPMDIWRLDFSVHNGSGRWLDHLIARFQIESAWPECTNWDVPDGAEFARQYPSAIIEWADSIGRIQESGRNVVSPGQTLTETRLFIVLRGDPDPRFSNWSTDFEAYLAQFPSGVFHALAENRLAELSAPANNVPGGAGSRRAEAVGSPGSGSRIAGGVGAARHPGDVFRDCDQCPEMVAMPGGGLALGRYEVTVGEYRAFASATGGGGDSCLSGGTWRDPGFVQTDRHPVACVSWDDAQEYVSWLSRTTGATYRLPTEAEWERAAAGSQRGCDRERTGNIGTCPVGAHGPNAAGLSDMVGNLWEWTEDCSEGDCGRRVLRGGSWYELAEDQRPGAHLGGSPNVRTYDGGFRVARTLD